MGFYGNITNTSNTTFQFDRIYPNRLSMDVNANNDGIFIGRYVLVEYERNAAYPVIYTKTVNSILQFYSSPNCEDITRIKFGTGNDRIYQNDIVKSYPQGTHESTTDGGEWPTNTDDIKFYRCAGEDINHYAIFVEITDESELFEKSDYIINYGVDENHYKPTSENERRNYKGYDSTVWTKVSETNAKGKLITKYVNIADLNSVVPTFDIAADAPTMSPITPHFDADNTNVYYKLHIQPQWGMRVAAANGSNSDVETYWTRENYNPSTGLSTKQYWNKNSGNWVNYDNEEEIQTFDAAIYYNRAGFEEYTRKHVDASLEDNIINIEPTGESGNLYSNHNKDNNNSTAKDIQEIRINLPAIGNMMSDAWDIIHGKQRNDYRGDGENASLQGRLDSFDAFYDNQIPVKRTNDGKIIGSRINGAAQYDNSDTWENEKKPVEVLYDTTLPNFDRDDAWIKTEVFTTGLKDGDKGTANDQNGNSGISIHHTFHATESSTSSVDKNIEDGNIKKDTAYKSDKIQSNNLLNINNKKDFIELYTPYVDAKGHVVGKNIETVTLPYGYKTFTTEGLAPLDNEGKEIVKDLYTTINNQGNGNNTSSSSASASTSIANNTQDSIAIEPYNKWIQTQLSDDKLVIAHEVHAINTETDTTDLNDLQDGKIQNEINIPDWDYDKAGHIKKKGEHTYTLPYGYKTIQTSNSDAVTAAPENTADAPTADNTQDVLNLNASNKWIKFNTTEATDNNEIQVGHILSPISSELNEEAFDKNEIEYKSSDTDISTFGGNFNILNFKIDNAGHIIAVGQDTIIIPQGKYEKDAPNTETSSLLVGLALDGPTGEITTTSATTNTLKLDNNYSANDGGLKIVSGDSINSGFSKIQNYINSLNETDTGQNVKQYVSAVTQSDGKITVSRAGTETLQISGYNSDTTDNKKIYDGNTINNAFKKLEDRIIAEEKARQDAIEALDLEDTIDETKYISGVSETDGKITVSRAGTNTLKLSNYSLPIGTVTDIDNNDTINAAFGKLQKQIKEIYGSDEIAESFNTIKEIADWLEANDSDANKVIDSIAVLQGNDTTAGSVANSIKIAIENLDVNDSAVSNQYVSAVSEADGKISVTRANLPTYTLTTGETNGTVKFNDAEVSVKGLGSAAYTDSNSYATATQGATAEGVANTIATYGDIVTYNTDDFVSKEEYSALLEDYNALKALVDQLNKQLNPELREEPSI